MTDRERYQELCRRESTIPIFSQDWWLDTVCGMDNWGVYLIGKDMDIKASLVYSLQECCNGKSIGRISLTQNNGIWIKYPKAQGIIARQSYEEKIVNEICDFIETLGLIKYDQQFHYHFTNYLPFFWRYYKETTKYTYVIEDTSDMERVRLGYSSKLKNVLRKAEKYLHIEEETDLEEFYSINKMSFERQGIEIPYSFEYFKKIYDACKERDSGMLLCARDEEGNTHSVAMLVWDKMSVYYLLNGTNPDLKQFQGNNLLIDYSIMEAHKRNLQFDFEGSVIKNVNHAFREFGGEPKPYFRITKEFREI
ncbi:MAG: GNAT family N-acetyltransferase [Lachnospiraceae bacterium]|jgi:hypothetical protein|nr:GNAT family N-acetyltransferase [Lachnospiraceae bacterium]